MVVAAVSKAFTKIFGSRNERLIKSYRGRVEQINALEPEYRDLTDAQLRAKTQAFRGRIADGEKIAAIMPHVLATAREVMDRSVGIRHIFDPHHRFDPAKLPTDCREVYEQVAQQAGEIEPVQVLGCSETVPGWQQVDLPNVLYDAVRELFPKSKPPFRARPFDVQLIGGMVLGQGRIAEMKTGEGKTIVAPLACYVAAIENLQCHVVTVNDYLVQRDRDWVFPFYYHLGLTVGAIHPFHMQPPEDKQRAYLCDVVYGTNSEFGFDYLRDNMKLSTAEQVQKRRDFCIIDEVDSILIDEARTPLIISGPAHDDAPRYGLADSVAGHLIQKQRGWDAADVKVQQVQMRLKGLEGDIRNARDKSKTPVMRQEMKQLQQQLPELESERDKHTQYYEVEREKKAAHLTHEGVAEAQKQAGIGSFYVGGNMDFPHLLENALRAHVIYKRDKEYVVQNGEVVIVDEFTGRLMIGRQWSDGLHQAVESKEKVQIKQETQTLATVTIQNFFKLYQRLAGMTGTAITESTEFNEIYRLEVVCIPTNVPVVRRDRDDLIFLSQKDKWAAILDEIKRVHDVGRPVLVGTTSVENSEMLAQMLTKKHGIHHEVLNAKQHEREAHIVEHAGQLGAVMIATNMAGRGTDIKLAAIDRSALVRHWQQRNLLPRNAGPDLADDQLITMCYRHQACQLLGIKPRDAQEKGDHELQLALLRWWVENEAMMDPVKVKKMNTQQCMLALDQVPDFMVHRLSVFGAIEEMGGLHIVGTERHEARRIDNQLRGRAGRQGDQGSSRFFISLEDDLMKLFAGKTTMAALSKLGMKEGDAIEHRWITKSVERAQRKVEERNYEIRKNLLEYDEVMEYQRNTFYRLRQDVLEGHNLQGLIFDYIADAVQDATDTYLDPDYVPAQIAEWCRQTLDVSVEPDKLRTDDLTHLHDQIRKEARAEVRQTVDVTLGEYMSHDMPSDEWDLKGLSHWAMSRFSVDLKQNHLRRMNVDQVKSLLVDAADQQLDRKDLSGAARFLQTHYVQQQLAEWARNKFGIALSAPELAKLDDDQVAQRVLREAHEAYRSREVSYPVQFILEMVFQAAHHDGPWAAQQLAAWANQRFEMQWTPEHVTTLSAHQLQEQLLTASEQWFRKGKLEALVDKAMADHASGPSLAQWAQKRFDRPIETDQWDELDDDGKRRVLIEKGWEMLRTELTQLERFVLLQILDTSWKDHLYAMDQLKDSVGLRGYAERDPRIEYKREGSNQFAQMRRTVRDRVTELIFRAKLTADVELRSVYQNQQARHAVADSGVATKGTAQQQADLEAAHRAGGGDTDQHMSRKQRRRAAAVGDEVKKSRQGFQKKRKRKSR